MSRTLAELPEGWEWAKLSDVCDVVNGVGFSTHLQGQQSLPYLFVKVSDMNATGNEIIIETAANTVDSKILKELGARVYPEGTIIFPKVGGALLTNKKRVLGKSSAFDNNIMGLVPKAVDSNWLFSFIQTIDLRDYANIQALPSVRKSDIENIKLPVPPIQERLRLSEHLAVLMAEVDKARAATEARLEAAEELPSAFLTDLFDQLLEYPQKKVREVASFSSGGTPSKAVAEYWSGDIPWVSPKDMHVSTVEDAQDHVSEQAVMESSTKLVEAGTILVVTRSGILARLLPVAITARAVTFNQDIKAVTANRALILPEFLCWAIKAREKYILTQGVKVGATVHSLRSGFLESLEIPVPPLSEQERLLETIDERQVFNSDLKRTLTTQLEAVNTLPASLLRQAFSGELTRQPTPEDLRAALTCLAVERLHHRVFFGVVQLMKVLYFGQVQLGIPFGYTIRRHTYGPFDKAVYELEKEGERQGWFSVDKAVDKQGSRYIPGAELDSLAREAEGTLGRWKGDLDGLLDLAETFDTTGLEALATLHAAWNDLLLEGRQPTDGEIISEVLECWPGKKEKFQQGELRTYLAYLKTSPYIPIGTGQSTRLTHAA